MDKILEFVSKYGDLIIILCGIALLIFMFNNHQKLVSQKERIKELLERRNRKYKKNKDTHELEEEDDDGAAITPDTIRKHENEFNAACSNHNVIAQLIPVFPLMGVFGTVAGLILNVKSADTAQMLSSLDVALSTTLWGLIFAIVLKVLDVVFLSKVINDVEVMLDNFYKKLDLANMYDNTSK